MPSRGPCLTWTFFGLYLSVPYATHQFMPILVASSSSGRLSVFCGVIPIRRFVVCVKLFRQSRPGRRWLNIISRILVALFLLLAVFGFICSVAGIAGVWYARSNARNAVIDVTTV